MSPSGRMLGSSANTRKEQPMTPDTLDRLVFHVAVFGLIALVLLPW